MTLQEVVYFGEETLEKAGIENANIDAFMLFEHAFEITKATYLLNKGQEAGCEKFEIYRELIERRANHEPCQYIMGKSNFCGFDLAVNENVLIPRQDTEVLVEEVLKVMKKGARVLDMCTGSGAIAIAVKKLFGDCCVTACDISREALAVAALNIKTCECEIDLVQGDLFENIDQANKFDVIVSNPPYVTNGEYEELMPEVKEHEPRLALTAGNDGLDIYKRLIKEAPLYLCSGGILAVEIGCEQKMAVTKLMEENGFEEIKGIKDLAGLDRVVIGRQRG